jgi:hypothetical protein
MPRLRRRPPRTSPGRVDAADRNHRPTERGLADEGDPARGVECEAVHYVPPTGNPPLPRPAAVGAAGRPSSRGTRRASAGAGAARETHPCAWMRRHVRPSVDEARPGADASNTLASPPAGRGAAPLAGDHAWSAPRVPRRAAAPPKSSAASTRVGGSVEPGSGLMSRAPTAIPRPPHSPPEPRARTAAPRQGSAPATAHHRPVARGEGQPGTPVGDRHAPKTFSGALSCGPRAGGRVERRTWRARPPRGPSRASLRAVDLGRNVTRPSSWGSGRATPGGGERVDQRGGAELREPPRRRRSRRTDGVATRCSTGPLSSP